MTYDYYKSQSFVLSVNMRFFFSLHFGVGLGI